MCGFINVANASKNLKIFKIDIHDTENYFKITKMVKKIKIWYR